MNQQVSALPALRDLLGRCVEQGDDGDASDDAGGARGATVDVVQGTLGDSEPGLPLE